LVHFCPSAAIRSRWGVAIVGCPKQAKSPYPRSSAKIRTMLGRSAVATCVKARIKRIERKPGRFLKGVDLFVCISVLI
jgi:hypothetical protein